MGQGRCGRLEPTNVVERLNREVSADITRDLRRQLADKQTGAAANLQNGLRLQRADGCHRRLDPFLHFTCRQRQPCIATPPADDIEG